MYIETCGHIEEIVGQRELSVACMCVCGVCPYEFSVIELDNV